MSQQPKSQLPIRHWQRRREADKDSVTPLRIRTWITLGIQILKVPKQRVVAKECGWPVAFDKFSLRRICQEIVDEGGAWSLRAHQIERELEGAKIFRAVDQDGVAGL